LALNSTKYIDGRSRNIHYAVVNKFLYTRAKEAKIRNTDPNCIFCKDNNRTEKENVIHGILTCPRLDFLWSKIEETLRKFNIHQLSELNKIFGFLGNQNEIQLNLLLQTAQKTIWMMRIKYDHRKKPIVFGQSLKLILNNI
jgi:hypothetical protein